MNKFTTDNMTTLMKSELNALAGSLAMYEGYQTAENYDFLMHASKYPVLSRHPMAKKYWNMAVVAWSCLKHDDEALEFQVK